MCELIDKISYYKNILESIEDNRIDLSLDHVNNWQLCRTCLTQTSESDAGMGDMCVMDVQEGLLLNVQDAVVYLVKLEMTDREDDLPLKVCTECLDKIKTFYNFAKQIQKAQQVLKLLATQLNPGKVNNSAVIKKEENLSEEFISINDEPPTQVIEVTSNVEVKKETTDTDECSINLSDPENICPSNQIFSVKEEDELIINDIHHTEQYHIDEILEVENLENNLDTLMQDATNNNSIINASQEDYNKGNQIRKQKTNNSKSRANVIPVDKSNTKKLKKQKSKTKTLETSGDILKGDSTINTTQEIYNAESSKILKKSTKPKRSRRNPVSRTPNSTNKCMVCQKIFALRSHFIRHVKELHPNAKAFKCRDCDMLFSRMPSLDRHHNVKHKNIVIVKKHICTYCSRSCYSKIDLEIHLGIHTGERPYSCSFCDKTFLRKSGLISHQMQHKEIESKGQTCPFCSKQFPTSSRLKDHLLVHTEERPFKCSLCGKAFKDVKSLNKHSKKHISNALSCLKCHKIFDFKVDLQRHVKQFHGETKDIKCDSCGKRFNSAHNLSRHIVRMHNALTDKYICEFCTKAFYRNSDLKSHLRQHTDERPYSCKLCEESFRHSLMLKRHLIRIHLKEFKCELCSKSFENISLFKRHLRLHTGDPIYACSLWEEAFKCRQDFNIQTFIKGPRNYVNFNIYKNRVCEFCSKKFSSYRNLKRHLKVHTGERPYSCHLCDKSYIDKYALNGHLQMHMNRARKYGHNKNLDISKEDKNQEDYGNLKLFTPNINDSGPSSKNHESKDPLKCTNNIDTILNTKNESLIEAKRRQNVKSMKLRFNRLMDYKCAACHKVFNFQRDFIRHAKKFHLNAKAFQCRSCKKAFASHRLLKSHFTRMHKDMSKKKNICEYCSKKFYTGAELRCHLKVHTGERLNKKAYKEKRNLNNIQHPQMPQIRENIYTCQNVSVEDNRTEKSPNRKLQSLKTIDVQQEQSCSNKNEKELMINLRNNHNISKELKTNRESLDPLKTSSVIKISETEFRYDETVINSAQRLDKIASEPLYRCEFCFESFKHKSSLKRHQKNYHLNSNADVNVLKTCSKEHEKTESTPTVIEENCSYLYDLEASTSGTSNIESSADYTKQNDEPGTSIKFQVNSESSKDKIEIEKPKSNSTPEQSVGVSLDVPQVDTEDCKITNVSTKKDSSLQRKPTTIEYICDQCQTIFKSKRRLNNHKESKHSEDDVQLNNLNKCTFCRKIFRRKCDLKTHLRIHTGEDPFICTICNESFQREHDLDNHMESHKANDNSKEPTVEEKERVRKKFLEFIKSMK